MKETIRKLFEVFLACHFLISIALGVCGMILGPGAKLGYEAMFAPTLMALLCTLPTLLTLGAERLTAGRYALRKALQVLLTEAAVLSMVYSSRRPGSVGEALLVASSVLAVFAGVTLILRLRSRMEADVLNRQLARLQRGE